MRNVLEGLLQDRKMWRAAPDCALVRDGYEVVDDLLDPPTCDRLVARFDELAQAPEALRGRAYFVHRIQGPTGRDQGVTQLMHAQDVDDDLRRLHDSGRIEAIFADRLGEPFVLESTTIQLDDPDTTTKRGFHVDRVTPPTFKLFIYLTDVPDLGNGPYTVVPGSHRHIVRKILNVAVNKSRRRQATDMGVTYRLAAGEPQLGGRGRTILSVQSMVHRGWPGHDRARRLVLIAYLVPTRHWSGAEFALGRDLSGSTEKSVTR
jgi:hypothetical protein